MVKAPVLYLKFPKRAGWARGAFVWGRNCVCGAMDRKGAHKVQFHGKPSLETYERMRSDVKLSMQTEYARHLSAVGVFLIL